MISVQKAYFGLLSLFIFGISNHAYSITNSTAYSQVDTHPYLKKADSLFEINQYEEALKLYSIAQDKFSEDQSYEGFIIAANKIAAIYTSYRNYKKAKTCLQNSYHIYQDKLSGEKALEADIYYRFGILYDRSKVPDSAIFFHHKALNFKLELFDSTDAEIALVFNAIGNVYNYSNHDYFTAELYYEKALHCYEQNNVVDKYLGNLYYNFATNNNSLGDYEKAISYAYKALNTYKYLRKDDYSHAAICHSILANTYFKKSDFGQAKHHYRLAIELINKNKKHAFGYLPYFYSNLGSIFLDTKEPDSTIFYCNYALTNLSESNPSDQEIIAKSLHSLGTAYSEKKRFDSASYFYNKALDIKLKYYGNKHPETATLFIDIGKYYEKIGQNQQALAQYQKALISTANNFEQTDFYVNPKIPEKGDIITFSEAISRKARVLRKLYILTKNEKYLKASVDGFWLLDQAITLNRGLLLREGSKLQLADDNKFIYEQALECIFWYYQTNKEDSILSLAYAFIEKNKSAILYEALQQAEIMNDINVPDSLILLEKSLDAKLAYYISELYEMKTEEMDSLQLKVFEVQSAQENLKNLLKNKFSNYYEVKYGSLYEIGDLQNFARTKRAKILQYFYGDSAVYLLSITPDTTHFSKLDKPDESMIENILEIFNSNFDINKEQLDYNTFQTSAYRLYKILLSHALETDHYTNLIIIPDGLLTTIPFDALLTKKQVFSDVDYRNLAYLLRNYDISYSFSCNVLMSNANKINNARGISEVYLGFSYTDEQDSNKGIQNLSGALREMLTIESVGKGTFFRGSKATEANFKKHVQNADILHLAMHGIADHQNPHKSRLIFRNEEDTVDDGNLHLHEIYSLRLKARLGILSACETGIGVHFQGEGTYSLARGFTYAGCPSLVMSLWKLNDQSTSKIISYLYENLGSGKTIDKSLKSAKMRFITEADEIFAHPKYWAGLVSIGVMDAITPAAPPRSSYNFWLLALFLGGIPISVYFIIRKRKEASFSS